MDWKKALTYFISIAAATGVLFGYGHHPTVDALLVAAVWFCNILIAVSLVILTAMVFLTRKDSDLCYSKEMGSFYESLSSLSVGLWENIISFLVICYWLYVFIIHQWTVTAVAYLFITSYARVFAYATKGMVKDYFLHRLKGEQA